MDSGAKSQTQKSKSHMQLAMDRFQHNLTYSPSVLAYEQTYLLSAIEIGSLTLSAAVSRPMLQKYFKKNKIFEIAEGRRNATDALDGASLGLAGSAGLLAGTLRNAYLNGRVTFGNAGFILFSSTSLIVYYRLFDFFQVTETVLRQNNPLRSSVGEWNMTAERGDSFLSYAKSHYFQEYVVPLRAFLKEFRFQDLWTWDGLLYKIHSNFASLFTTESIHMTTDGPQDKTPVTILSLFKQGTPSSVEQESSVHDSRLSLDAQSNTAGPTSAKQPDPKSSATNNQPDTTNKQQHQTRDELDPTISAQKKQILHENSQQPVSKSGSKERNQNRSLATTTTNQATNAQKTRLVSDTNDHAPIHDDEDDHESQALPEEQLAKQLIPNDNDLHDDPFAQNDSEDRDIDQEVDQEIQEEIQEEVDEESLRGDISDSGIHLDSNEFLSVDTRDIVEQDFAEQKETDPQPKSKTHAKSREEKESSPQSHKKADSFSKPNHSNAPASTQKKTERALEENDKIDSPYGIYYWKDKAFEYFDRWWNKKKYEEEYKKQWKQYQRESNPDDPMRQVENQIENAHKALHPLPQKSFFQRVKDNFTNFRASGPEIMPENSSSSSPTKKDQGALVESKDAVVQKKETAAKQVPTSAEAGAEIDIDDIHSSKYDSDSPDFAPVDLGLDQSEERLKSWLPMNKQKRLVQQQKQGLRTPQQQKQQEMSPELYSLKRHMTAGKQLSMIRGGILDDEMNGRYFDTEQTTSASEIWNHVRGDPSLSNVEFNLPNSPLYEQENMWSVNNNNADFTDPYNLERKPGFGGQYGGGNPYGGNQYGNQYGNQFGNPYGGNQFGNQYGGNQFGNPYGGNQYGNPYGNQYGGNPYGDQYGNQYDGNGFGNPYGGNPYGGNQYGGNPYGGNQYGGNPYGGNQYGSQYGGNFGGSQYGNSYGENQFGNPYGGNQYGNQFSNANSSFDDQEYQDLEQKYFGDLPHSEHSEYFDSKTGDIHPELMKELHQYENRTSDFRQEFRDQFGDMPLSQPREARN